MELNRKEIILKTSSNKIYVLPIEVEDGVLYSGLEDFVTYTETQNIEGDTILCNIELEVLTDEEFMLICPIRVPKIQGIPYIMIPGFLYGSNNLKYSLNSPFPKLDYGKEAGWPSGGIFSTRADRSTHHCMLGIYGKEGLLIGVDECINGIEYSTEDVWAPRYLYNGFFIDTSGDHFDLLGFTIGYEHFPKRYTMVWEDPKTPGMDEYKTSFIKGQKGKTLQLQAHLYTRNIESLSDYGSLLQGYYGMIHQALLKRADRLESIKKIADAIIEYGWQAEHKYFYLCDNEDGRTSGDIAWVGGMQAAYPLLKAGIKIDEIRYKNVAIEFMDNLCRNVLNEKAGLFYEEFRDGIWQVTGWWGIRKNCLNIGDNPLHSAYLNGQASYYVLKSLELLSTYPPEWLNAAKTVLETALKSQNEDGAYACFFSPKDGQGVDYIGFHSCWFTPGMILLAKATKEERYLTSAKRAIEFYISQLEGGEIFGTPMDTHNAVDQEGNLSFLIACVEMHKITKEDKYLKYALKSCDWEFSWKFAYNTVFSNDPLRKMNWSSCGGSITSVHNPHIHHMGNLVAGELFYVYQQTKSSYIGSRLKDTCIWGLGSYNTKDNDFGFGKTGHATEQFFYSDALLLPWYRPHDGGVWEAYLPWCTASVLLSCAEDIPDEFFNA